MSSPVPSAGRLSPAPFFAGAVAVYLLSFGSQVLLSPPVTSRLSVLPFLLAQAMLIALWIVLHVRRLNDAGRPTGTAIGIAMVYAIEVVLLVLLIWLMLSAVPADGGGAGPEASILHLFVLLYFLSLLAGDPDLGGLQLWVMGFVVLMLLPVAIALIFSVWAGTRPQAAPPIVPADRA